MPEHLNRRSHPVRRKSPVTTGNTGTQPGPRLFLKSGDEDLDQNCPGKLCHFPNGLGGKRAFDARS